MLVLVLLVQGRIEVAVLVGLYALWLTAPDPRGASSRIWPIDIVAVQLLHGLVANNLRDLGQSVIGLEDGQGLGEELQRLITNKFTKERIY